MLATSTGSDKNHRQDFARRSELEEGLPRSTNYETSTSSSCCQVIPG